MEYVDATGRSAVQVSTLAFCTTVTVLTHASNNIVGLSGCNQMSDKWSDLRSHYGFTYGSTVRTHALPLHME
jgi:hypothetical protein